MAVGGSWPARTYDTELIIRDPKSVLSKKDISSIHEFVWQKYPQFRIFGIQVINSNTVLIGCANQPGKTLNYSEGLELIRSG